MGGAGFPPQAIDQLIHRLLSHLRELEQLPNEAFVQLDSERYESGGTIGFTLSPPIRRRGHFRPAAGAD